VRNLDVKQGRGNKPPHLTAFDFFIGKAKGAVYVALIMPEKQFLSCNGLALRDKKKVIKNKN
jgi:hypothetical protein